MILVAGDPCPVWAYANWGEMQFYTLKGLIKKKTWCKFVNSDVNALTELLVAPNNSPRPFQRLWHTLALSKHKRFKNPCKHSWLPPRSFSSKLGWRSADWNSVRTSCSRTSSFANSCMILGIMASLLPSNLCDLQRLQSCFAALEPIAKANSIELIVSKRSCRQTWIAEPSWTMQGGLYYWPLKKRKQHPQNPVATDPAPVLRRFNMTIHPVTLSS